MNTLFGALWLLSIAAFLAIAVAGFLTQSHEKRFFSETSNQLFYKTFLEKCPNGMRRSNAAASASRARTRIATGLVPVE